MKIYKYPLPHLDSQVHHLPMDSKILSVQVQDREIMMWVMVDEDTVHTYRCLVEIFATGEEFNTHGSFIGTVQLNDCVWHIFGGEQ